MLSGLIVAGCTSGSAPERCRSIVLEREIRATPVERVDLLFVVDDSRSMGAAQARLAGSATLLGSRGGALDRGRAVCTLEQLAPADRSPLAAGPAEPGWYYDDFSGERACERPGAPPLGLAFNTEIPDAAVVRLTCFEGSLALPELALPSTCPADP